MIAITTTWLHVATAYVASLKKMYNVLVLPRFSSITTLLDNLANAEINLEPMLA